MAVTPPGQAPALHKTVSTPAQTMWTTITASLSAKNNISKAFTHQELATAAGVSLSAVEGYVNELISAAPEHFQTAGRTDANGNTVKAYLVAPSNLVPFTNA